MNWCGPSYLDQRIQDASIPDMSTSIPDMSTKIFFADLLFATKAKRLRDQRISTSYGQEIPPHSNRGDRERDKDAGNR